MFVAMPKQEHHSFFFNYICEDSTGNYARFSSSHNINLQWISLVTPECKIWDVYFNSLENVNYIAGLPRILSIRFNFDK